MSFEVLFWLGPATVVYTFAGYPVVISLLAALQRRMPRQAASSILPTVSVVVVAYNERSRLPARLENLLTSEFPPDKLEIIVVSDGSTDGTEQSVPPEYASRVRMLVQPSRLGKAAGLNRALASATGEIVVFADARQRFAPNAIN